MADLTLNQYNMARHALGLPNPGRKSYRNRYTAGVLSHTFEAWSAMVDAGLATAYPHDDEGNQRGGLVTFCLTRAGANAVLEMGERLDAEDFPPEAKGAA